MAATHVVQIGTYVTPETQAAVKAAAQREGVPVARWVRGAILKKLKGAQNGKG